MSGDERLAATFVAGFHDPSTFLPAQHFRALGQTGLLVSALSVGGTSFGSLYGEVDEEEAETVLRTLLTRGVNLIDTAPWYGQGKSEALLGKLLRDIPRQAYYLTTKVGRYELEPSRMFDFSRARTLSSVEDSLRLLQVDYVDVIQGKPRSSEGAVSVGELTDPSLTVHDLEFAPSLDVIINETLPALQEIKERGKARFIGITGYPLNLLEEVIERSAVANPHIKIDTVLSYSRCTLHDTTLLDHLPYFGERGVGVINAAPVSMGLLSHTGPPAWHPAPEHLKRVCKEAAGYCHANGINISKLALHFALTHSEVATTLVGTVRLPEMHQNLDVLLHGISQSERECMEEVRERFFLPLGNVHWEGIEVGKYRKKLQEKKPSSS